MTQQSLRILRFKQVSELTGLKHTSIYEKIKSGEFPPSISLGTRARGWVASEIEGWISERIKASRGETNHAV